MSYDPLLTLLGLTSLATATVPTTFAATAYRGGVAIAAAALPSNPTTGTVAIDSGASNALKWWNGSSWQSAGGGSATLTSTYIGYGNGSNVLTGESAFTYNATTNTMTVEKISAGGTTAVSATAVNVNLTGNATSGTITTVIALNGQAAVNDGFGASTATYSNLQSLRFSLPTASFTNAASTVTISNLAGIYLESGTVSASGGATLTVTTLYGIYIGTVTFTGATVTNRYGVYQEDAAAKNVFLGRTETAASTTTRAGLLVPHGTAPSSPTNGDVWTTTAGMYARINGTTVGPFGAGATPGGSNTQLQYNNSGSFGGLAGFVYTTPGSATTDYTATRTYTGSPTTGTFGTFKAVLNVAPVTTASDGVGAAGAFVTNITNVNSIIGIGAVAAGVTATLTDTGVLNGTWTGPMYGLSVSVTKSVTNTTGGLIGEGLNAGRFVVNTVGSCTGLHVDVNKNASGDAAVLAGAYVRVRATHASGAITDMYGVYIERLNVDAGSVTTGYGLYIEGSPSLITTYYGVYQAGGALNYLEGYTGVGVAPSTSAFLTLAAPTTARSSLRLTHGTSPSVPVDGDMWTTTAGLYVRINGVTVGPLSAGLAGSIASGQVAYGAGVNTVQGSSALTYTTTGGLAVAPAVVNNSTPVSFSVTGAANTLNTAGTEVSDIVFNLNRTVQWAATSFAVQRAIVIDAPTYAFDSSSTITEAATVAITGPPSAGTNASITRAYALWVQSGRLKVQNASTQDSIVLEGRVGGTSNWNAVITPGTLTSSITLTTPVSSGTITVGTGAASRVAYWSGTNTVTSSAALTFSTTSGASLLANPAGTSTATTAVTAGFDQTITYTGVATTNKSSISGTATFTTANVNTAAAVLAAGIFTNNITSPLTNATVTGVQSVLTATPTGAVGAINFSGSLVQATRASAANTFFASASLLGQLVLTTFSTANTTGAAVAAAVVGVKVTPSITTTNASGTNTIANVYGLWVAPGTFSSTGGGGMTLTNYYGLYLGSVTLTTMTITNRFGIYQQDTAALNYFAGDVSISTAGKGLLIKEGSNARMGVATLVAGTVTVSTTAVTANSRIFLCCNTQGGTVGSVYVSARTAGTSFAITSTSGTDTSSVAWMIVEPAA